MKTFLAVFALCIAGTLAALSEEQITKLKTYKESCIEETGVDPSVIEAAKKGTYSDGDEKLACFSACLLKKIGVMDPDGKINEEVIRSKIPSSIPKDQADNIINTCKGLTGANACETAGKVLKVLSRPKHVPLLMN
uniref:Odorant binding protein 9 n=1 Tax=Cephus cinctus TaxID=211228 RepID=A0A1W6L179_CEPCN|nr:odorant binding protein 9 [Cephus cinctus]